MPTNLTVAEIADVALAINSTFTEAVTSKAHLQSQSQPHSQSSGAFAAAAGHVSSPNITLAFD